MQRRSYDLYLEGRKIVADGKLGTVRMVRSWWLNNYLTERSSTSWTARSIGSSGRDPAARRPLDPDRFRNWRFYSDYAGGILADQGAHVFDGIHMLMNAGYPLAVTAAAGKPHKPKGGHAGVGGGDRRVSGGFHRRLHRQLRGHAVRTPQRPDESAGRRQGAHGHRPRGVEGLQGGRGDRAHHRERSRRTASARPPIMHVQNFLECVRTRKTPTAPMRLGFQAALVVQMANISLKSGPPREVECKA